MKLSIDRVDPELAITINAILDKFNLNCCSSTWNESVKEFVLDIPKGFNPFDLYTEFENKGLNTFLLEMSLYKDIRIFINGEIFDHSCFQAKISLGYKITIMA